MRTRRSTSTCLAMIGAATMTLSAQAGVVFDLEGVTNNNAGDVLIGEAQFGVELMDLGAGLISLRFTNMGPEASSIASVFIDGDRALEIDSLTNGPGVLFADGGSPSNLPGGQDIGFDADFWATAEPPPATNGVDPDEYLDMVLAHSGSFEEVVGDMMSGEMRVGLHAIAFDSGGSESFVTVPAPGAFALLGIAGMAAGRRRRRH